ncbi:uncharacterized protein [Penaeus vannamei]|uniref:uncharacterized protein n=1 Tax=Penaeus vannamei TaxID=6689 RepID=UPI00387F4298
MEIPEPRTPATSIRVERVVVPPVVLAGRRVKLECQYEEDGDRLYSLKWWHGDDQFYQFIPPHRKHFPVPGVTVNWSATATLNELYGTNGHEVVVLERVGLASAGVYKCEVMADMNFRTEFQQANMTVIYAPEGPPTIRTGPGTHFNNITSGQIVTLNCSSPPASPPPVLTWYINGRRVDSTWVTNFGPLFKRNLARASSRLELPITASLVSSGTSLMVTCVATQGGSAHGNPSYNSSTYVMLKPRRPPSFWEGLFSSAASGVEAFLAVELLLLLLALSSALSS